MAYETGRSNPARGFEANGRKVTIYADYQATTPVDPRVLEKMAPYWNELFGNPHSSDHVVGWRSAEAVQNAASSVGALIGADPDEIVFTSGPRRPTTSLSSAWPAALRRNAGASS